jgi:hypothetical protein
MMTVNSRGLRTDCDQDSSISIVMGWKTNEPGFVRRQGVKGFYSHRVQIGYGTHPISFYWVS